MPRRKKKSPVSHGSAFGRQILPRSRPETTRSFLCINKSQTYSAFQNTATAGYVFSPSTSSLSFELTQSPDFSSFATVFDQYRVRCVDVHFTWINGQNISTTTQGCLFFVSDPDGGSIPANYELFTNYRRLWRFNLPLLDGLNRDLKGLPTTTQGSIGQILADQWMDCAEASAATFVVGFTAMLKRATSPSGINDTLMVQYRPQVEFRYRR